MFARNKKVIVVLLACISSTSNYSQNPKEGVKKFNLNQALDWNGKKTFW